MGKSVIEDWSYFNAAVRRRAEPPPVRPAGIEPEAPPLIERGRRPEMVPLRATPPAPPPPPVAKSGTRITPPMSTGALGRGDRFALLLALALIFVLVATGLVQSGGHRPVLARADARTSVPASVGTQAIEPGEASATVTDYTTFHRVPFRRGAVVTGWNFARSGDPAPTDEYCYFDVPSDAGRMAYSIESRPRGRGDASVIRYPPPEALVRDVGRAGWDEAASKCHWHPSGPPASQLAPPPAVRAT